MTWEEVLVNIISIVVSLVLSVGGIWLSILFYRESNRQNKETALMQQEIKNSVQKLEQLYDRVYTDTFAALKTQIDAMQKHIFTPIPQSSTTQPEQIRFYVLGCISERNTLSIDDLCSLISTFKEDEIKKIVYTFHKEGIIAFDGQLITYLKNNQNGTGSGNIQGNTP